ncbi:MAG: TetR/AcrR family transcriptional regulator, partial [Candidatus Acidiferrales bacterium]
MDSLQRSAERRARLIQAGVQVFGTKGFHSATVKQICAEAGLTERYFYESFENLNALFLATYDHELERLRAVLM